MATLEENITALAEEIAADVNAQVAKIGDLLTLDTTVKDSLVEAINEVLAAVGSGGSINADSITDATTVGKALIRAATAAAARTAIGAGTSNLVVGTGSGDAKAGDYQPTWAQVTDKPAVIAAGVTMADARTAIGAVSSSDVTAAVAGVVGGAGAAYDTLIEVQAILESNDGALDALTTAVNNSVKWSAAQSLTSPQQAQARANIGAYGAPEIGNPDTDFAAAYTAARNA